MAPTGYSRVSSSSHILLSVTKRLLSVAFLVAGGLVIQILGVAAEPVAVTAIGAVVVGGAVLGVLRHGRHHPDGWRQVWRAEVVGLLLVVGAGFARQWAPSHVPNGTAAALSIGGDLAALLGLVRMMRLRLPGRAGQLLLEGAVPVLAIGLVVWMLAVEPAATGRFGVGITLARLLVPLFDALVFWQLLQLLAVTSRTPAAYKYLASAFVLLLVGDGLRAATILGHGGLMPVQPTNVLQLWAWALWAVAVSHPSQRRPFPAVPARNARPSGMRVGAVLGCVVTGPALFVVLPLLGRHLNTADLVAGAALIPVVVVAYLVTHVYSRANAEYHAQHDSLTGLCNRTLFEYQLGSAISVARRSGTQVGVMFLDVDRFKGVNDSLGHAVGNELLKAVAQRVESCVRDHDLVARMGGDEFTVLLPDLASREAGVEIAERVLEAFSRPFRAGGRQLAVTTSVGVALFPGDGDDAESLLKNADTAMYRAKAAGRNTVEAYNADMSARAHVRFALENSLRAAMQKGELTVFYQPRVEIATGRVAAVEALARWHHRRLGFISLFAFVSLAEETGLIAPLGEWVLEAACRQARAWSDAGFGPVPVSVNLSPQQFADRPMLDLVTDVLGRTGLAPELLELELTESLFMQDREAVVASLGALRDTGVRCSIDDFGTGYSALSYLADIPMDTLKIDQSFVRRIEGGATVAPLVGAVISLAHSLGLSVVAEGVETEEQLEYLRLSGCEQAQGYIFSPALPAPTVELILRRQRRSDETGALMPLWTSPLDGAPFEDPTTVSVDQLASGRISPGRMAEVLHALCQDTASSADLDDSTVEAILTALQGDVVSGASGGLRSRSMKVAVGTLAGLVPLAGSVAGAGFIPGSLRGVAAALSGGLGIQPSNASAQPSDVLAMSSEGPSGSPTGAGSAGGAPSALDRSSHQSPGEPNGDGNANAMPPALLADQASAPVDLPVAAPVQPVVAPPAGVPSASTPAPPAGAPPASTPGPVPVPAPPVTHGGGVGSGGGGATSGGSGPTPAPPASGPSTGTPPPKGGPGQGAPPPGSSSGAGGSTSGTGVGAGSGGGSTGKGQGNGNGPGTGAGNGPGNTNGGTGAGNGNGGTPPGTPGSAGGVGNNNTPGAGAGGVGAPGNAGGNSQGASGGTAHP